MTHEQRDRTRGDKNQAECQACLLRCGDGPGSAEPSRRSCARVRTNHWPRPRAARGRQSWGEIEINTPNIAGATSRETVRNLPCTPVTELGRLGAFNAGGRLELLRVVTQLLRVVTPTGGHFGQHAIDPPPAKALPPNSPMGLRGGVLQSGVAGRASREVLLCDRGRHRRSA